MSDSSSSDESVEWEEVVTNEQSPLKDLHIVLKGRARSKASSNKQSLRAYHRQLQIDIHKVHLLCLLSHGQCLISQCDQQINKCLLLSLTPNVFSLDDPLSLSGERSLGHFLRWFVANVHLLKEASSLTLSDVQLLVSLCKSLGLRTRLVLVLQPASLKLSKDDSSTCISGVPESPVEGSSKTSFSDTIKGYQYEKQSIKTRKRKRKEITTSPYFESSSSSAESSGFKSKREKLTEGISNVELSPPASTLYNTYSSWAEVLVPDNKWTPLHLPSVSVGQAVLCEKHSSTIKLHYILAFEHAAVISDVTPRYASQWCNGVCKLRVDSNWWNETLLVYAPPHHEVELEDKDIKKQLLSAPLPTVLSHYKNHPLYALRKHLLKYEAIYPEDSHVLGHYKGQPVYSRDSIHTLHTRESWLKEGLVVKQGEEPFKIVIARKRKSSESLNDTNHLFGHWQTRLYIPPPVVDGHVPKNEYGNVELFTSTMLPEGAVHLTVDGIGKVARKLNIDCARAMKGWEFSTGSCYPVFDGIVVGKEYEDILLEAWEQEQQISIEKSIKKRQIIILGRWSKVTKSLLIHERVKQRYNQNYNY